MKKDCVFIDVFTNMPFAGNQLAVFPSADDLTDAQMQKLANEINYSETTFVQKSNNSQADYNIRIFTPKSEIPFAGHPTLGTAYSLLNVLDNDCKDKKSINLRTKVGVIPLVQSNEVIWMKQNEPEFFDTYEDLDEIASLVGLKGCDIQENLPIEEVSTGNTILIVPIEGLTSIRKAQGNMDRIAGFFAKHNSIAPYIFSFETENQDAKVHTRLFAPHFGIIEDPATGSAAGPLVAYLLKHKVFGDQFEIQNEQGIEIKRPSRIMMRGSIKDDKYRIEIGGKCCFVGKAIFYV
ncbi:MAG: PhzF family phenazine biosynthesis protein [Sedimentisphaerales bacterium]|nr:PhzF family phenazine biosynthesis protein [Sedimentisphaerales bacterium]